jgi:hypothetical protein
MSFSRVLTVFALVCLAVSAQDGKPNLSGNWQLKDPTKTTTAMTMLIEQKGNSVHIVKAMTGADGKEQKLEFQCATDGKECEAGSSKISLWFDGAALVVMDAGEAVSKVTIKMDGKQLKVEVSHIFPDGEPETYLLAKI